MSLILGEVKIKSVNHLFCKKYQNNLVQSPLFPVIVPVLVLLEFYFVIDKLSTDLKIFFPYYVNHLMTKVVLIDINCNPLVELKIILILC